MGWNMDLMEPVKLDLNRSRACSRCAFCAFLRLCLSSYVKETIRGGVMMNDLNFMKRVFVVLLLSTGLMWASQGRAQDSVIYVRPGDSLRDAVRNAPAGSTIIVAAGVYREALVVSQPNIRLIGAGASDDGTVLSNEGVNAETGITVMPGADNFQLAGFLVRGFNENGIRLSRVRDYRVTNNVFLNNGEYAVFPVFSTGGVISNNIASGHMDASLYVGQSTGAVISHNKVFGNVIGIEVENSADCTVTENEAYNNALGILIVELPLLDVKTTNRVTVSKNLCYNNNNTEIERALEIFIQAVPVGGGILVVAADSVTVSDNITLGNRSFGIAIARLPELFDDFDPDLVHIADNSRVTGNLCLRNGRDPEFVRLPESFPRGANLIWDETGAGHCFERNVVMDDVGGTSFPSPAMLPKCLQGK
jgi:parallel beta-helix repeat protein